MSKIEIRHAMCNMHGYTVHLYFPVDKDDLDDYTGKISLISNSKLLISAERLQLLQETKEIDLGNTYSAYKHYDHSSQFADPLKTHLHVYKRGKQIFAINRDGTAHDGYHGVLIPGAIYNTLTREFPDFQFPPNRLIENMQRLSDIPEIEISQLDEELDSVLCELIDKMDITDRVVID